MKPGIARRLCALECAANKARDFRQMSDAELHACLAELLGHFPEVNELRELNRRGAGGHGEEAGPAAWPA